jgi:ABC-type dipeptide/oligopeptide/nickel transport system permease component
MTSYLIRRLGIAAVTLLLITFLVYGLIRAMPGTPVTGDIAQMDPSKQLTPEAIERLNRLYGLDKPWYTAYFVWAKNLLRFDLGVSFTRNMQEVVRQDYIRTARAKGVGPRTILWKHAFRNTLIPLVTLLGLTLPSLFSGAVILEQIFQWPGMGRLYFEAIGQRDYNVVMGLTLMFSVLTLLGQLLADVLYAVVDPRVSYS